MSAYSDLLGRWERVLDAYLTCQLSRIEAAKVGGVLRAEAGELHARGWLSDEERKATRGWVLPPAHLTNGEGYMALHRFSTTISSQGSARVVSELCQGFPGSHHRHYVPGHSSTMEVLGQE